MNELTNCMSAKNSLDAIGHETAAPLTIAIVADIT